MCCARRSPSFLSHTLSVARAALITSTNSNSTIRNVVAVGVDPVVFDALAATTVVVSGCVVRGGANRAFSIQSGASASASATIDNVQVTDRVAGGSGGALLVDRVKVSARRGVDQDQIISFFSRHCVAGVDCEEQV